VIGSKDLISKGEGAPPRNFVRGNLHTDKKKLQMGGKGQVGKREMTKNWFKRRENLGSLTASSDQISKAGTSVRETWGGGGVLSKSVTVLEGEGGKSTLSYRKESRKRRT